MRDAAGPASEATKGNTRAREEVRDRDAHSDRQGAYLPQPLSLVDMALTGGQEGEGAAERLHVRSPGSPELGTAAPISRQAGQ